MIMQFANGNEICWVSRGAGGLFSGPNSPQIPINILEISWCSSSFSIALTSTSSARITDLIFAIEKDVARRRRKITNFEGAAQNGTVCYGILSIVIYGFAGQDEVACGLGCNITLKRNGNNDVIWTAATVVGKVVIKRAPWQVAKYIPSLENQLVQINCIGSSNRIILRQTCCFYERINQ